MSLIVKSLPGVDHPQFVERPRKIRVFPTDHQGLGNCQRHLRPQHQPRKSQLRNYAATLLLKQLNVL